MILGATSLDEVMTGIDGLSRATAQNERLAREAAAEGPNGSPRCASNWPRSATGSTAPGPRRAPARRGSRPPSRAGARRSPAIRRQAALTQQRLAALEAQAHEAEQRSAGITAASASSSHASQPPIGAVARPPPTTPAAPATPAPLRSAGTHTLVVDAVAYHLPGNTASGLPVGVGVIAVDPTVIPLGTRVFVPGYGPAVAADVGSAIKGNIIDLWMPTTAQALAWGRRTVTITIYG